MDTHFSNPWTMPPPSTFAVHDQMSSPVFPYGWQSSQLNPRSMSTDSPEVHHYHQPAQPVVHPGLRRSFTYHPESTFGAIPQTVFAPPIPQNHATPVARHHDELHSPWQMVSPTLPSHWNVSAGEYVPKSAVEHPPPWLPSSQGLADVKEEDYQRPPRPP